MYVVDVIQSSARMPNYQRLLRPPSSKPQISAPSYNNTEPMHALYPSALSSLDTVVHPSSIHECYYL